MNNEDAISQYLYHLSLSEQDTNLVFKFFLIFSRMEYALKCLGFVKVRHDQKRDDVSPDWDAFAKRHRETFESGYSERVAQTVEYIRTSPPMTQVYTDTRLGWKSEPSKGEREVSLGWILVMARRVRNNLFHGGKFPTGPIDDPVRDRRLIESATVILEYCLELDPILRRQFIET